MLPLYAAYSLLRMLGAYALSLGFALGAGYWASASPLGRRLILPALDVLQAVPILGFFPAAIFFFIRLFHGSPLGVEAAAVFLIFTSQAWNMAFSVYESLTTIPDDLLTAARVSGLSGVVRWRRLLLPACMPRLVYNSMLSWAGGWYFLIASEIIAVGRRTWVLPGLGSYIGEAITLGRPRPRRGGPRVARGGHRGAERRPLEPARVLGAALPLRDEHRRRSDGPAARALPPAARPARARRARARRPAAGRGAREASRPRLARAVARLDPPASRCWGRWRRSCALAYGAVQTVEVLLRPLPPEAAEIPAALLRSFLRLLLAYAISLAWTIPVACWVSRSATRAGRLMPIVQVLASVPATAFFPVLVALVLWLRLDLNVSAVALVLTGMQWYLLFNLVAAAQAMPEDLRELARATGARGFFYLRRFFLPAALPSLITGSLTAWGGGWNALVLSESVTAAGRTWSVKGIGTLLDQATYVKGDLQMITLVIVSMVTAVLLLNRAVWRPLYAWASVRYRLDA